jgi:hypothetical protein
MHAVVDELHDFGCMLVHRGDSGAEEAFEGLLRDDAGGEGVGDTENHFAVAEVKVEGTLAFAVVHAGKEVGAGIPFRGRDLDGNAAEKRENCTTLGGVDDGGPEKVVAAEAVKEHLTVFRESGREFPRFKEFGSGLEYGDHQIGMGSVSSAHCFAGRKVLHASLRNWFSRFDFRLFSFRREWLPWFSQHAFLEPSRPEGPRKASSR